MTTKTPREEARAWLQRSLVANFPDNAAQHAATLEEYGDGLFAIAEQFNIPDETLLFWISDKPAWKDWSLTSFRRYAAAYDETRKLMTTATPFESELPKEELETRAAPAKLCMRCFANLLQQLDDRRWWCQKCGEVQ